MSKNNQVITISPPMFIGEGNQKESISSKGHRCSYCHGNGFFWGEEQRERVKVDCPVCKGSGKLDAVITIEWKPAIHEKCDVNDFERDEFCVKRST